MPLMRDLFQCAWREVTRRRGRTAANVAGYLLATALLVILVSLLQYARAAAAPILAGTGTHFIAVTPICAGGPCETLTADPLEGFFLHGTQTRLLKVSALERLNADPNIALASPYLLFRLRDGRGGLLTVGGFRPDSTTAVATTCCAAADVIEGHYLADDERGAVMLEAGYAAARGLHAGGRLTVARRAFTIAGVVNPGVRPAKADVYLHFDDATRLINTRLTRPLAGEANVVLVEVAQSTVQREAMAAVKAALPEMQISSYACWKPAATVLGMTEGAAWLLALCIGAGAVALALRAQWATVLERRREIGILKAIGWSNGVIVMQIVLESLLQALAGGALGIVAAAVLLRAAPVGALTSIAAGPVPLSPFVALCGVLLPLLGGVIAGIVPALAAARRHPAEALRTL
jgi:putative ABC transport system permease protein